MCVPPLPPPIFFFVFNHPHSLNFSLISILFLLTDEEHARALEEQWIDALGSGGSAGAGTGSPESDSRARAVLNGIVIGFFFPLLPFFFFRGSKPAAFFESGHAIETAESTVFSCAVYPIHFCKLKLTLSICLGDACRWAWLWVSS